MNDRWKEHNKQMQIKRIRLMEQHGSVVGALCEATRFGHMEEILRLLDAGADVNAGREYDGITPLMLANAPKIAKLLIDRGADVNARDNEGRTPLLWFLLGLAHKRTAEKYIRTLLEAGAGVRVQSPEGHTAQALAESKYGLDVAKLLEPK
jgi:ankyrin repeat protein